MMRPVTAVEALRVVAAYDGLVRFTGQGEEQRTCRVMLRLRRDPEQRVVATQDLGTDDPLDVMAATVAEALAEVQAQEVRWGLRLVGS